MNEDDGLGFFHGCLFATPVAIALWMLILWPLWAWLR